MKKIIIFVMLFMTIYINCHAQESVNLIIIPDKTTLLKDEFVSVDIVIDADSNLEILQFDINYDAFAFDVPEITYTSLLKGTKADNTDNPGIVKFGFYGNNLTAGGTIMTLKFKAKKAAKTQIILSDVVMRGTQNDPFKVYDIPYLITNTEITVKGFNIEVSGSVGNLLEPNTQLQITADVRGETSDNIPPVLIIALYSNRNQLINSKMHSQELDETKKMETTFDLGNIGKGCRLKVFLWDNITHMIPLEKIEI